MNSNSRHIVIFSALASPSMGGVERFTDELSNELVKHGYNVTIVTNNTHATESVEMLENSVEIVRLPCFPLLHGRMPWPKISKQFFVLWNRILKLKCSGVLVNTRFYAHSILGLMYAKRMGVCPVVLDHGSAYLTFGNPILDLVEHGYEHLITAAGKRYHGNYYGISQKSSEWLGTFGISSKGIISNSIDAVQFRRQSSGLDYRSLLKASECDLLVTFTGRLVPEKGIDTLLKAMRMLEGQPIKLAVAGDGPLRSMIESSGISNISVLGKLSMPDIAALLISSDLFCIPSRSEGFCTSLLEASACGTPSIATDIGGARELIPDSSYGIILQSNDPRELASSLIDALDNKTSLRKKGDRCRALVEKEYSWNNTALQMTKAMGFFL